MIFQQVLILSTRGPELRSEALGWGGEDGSEASKWVHQYPSHEMVGMIRGGIPKQPLPATPLHALGYGWKLLAPPIQNEDEWEWWFVRDVIGVERKP